MKWPEQIRNGTCYGLCEPAKSTISLERGLSNRKLLEITIHEMLHAEFPKANEWSVTQAAKDIAGTLWRMGFRDTK